MNEDEQGEAAQWVTLLREGRRNLSPAEAKVASIVLSAPEEAMRLSITELSERAGVGEATVSRLARRLGFSGFHAFKIAIAQRLAPEAASQNQLPETASDYPSWLRSSLGRVKTALDESLALFSADDFERAVGLLTKARRIEWYGSGSSGAMATIGHQRFIVLGVPGAAYSDPHLQMVSASTLGPQDVVVGLSKSGATKDLHDTLTAARRSGAKAITVTSTSPSPLTALSDVMIVVGGQGGLLVGNLFDEVTTMVAIELLAQACARELGEPAKRNERAAVEALSDRLS